MRKKILPVCLAIYFLSTGAILAVTIGHLTLEKGVVKLRRQNVETVIQERGVQIPLDEKDALQTGSGTEVKVHLSAKKDDIILASNTRFLLTSIKEAVSEVSMPTGKARFIVKKRLRRIKGRKRFRLKTANAIVGVKGTEFVAAIANGTTNVLTLEGEVTMANVSAPEIEVEVKTNQASQIQQEARPTIPVEVPPNVINEILKTDDPKAFNNVQFGAEVKETPASTQKKDEKKAAPAATKGSPQPTVPTGTDLVEGTEETDIIEEVNVDELIAEVQDIISEVNETVETIPIEREVIITVTD